MPDMDGYDLYQTVKKKKTPSLPVVLMTAFNYDKDHIIKRSCLEGLQGVIFQKAGQSGSAQKTSSPAMSASASQSTAVDSSKTAIEPTESPKVN